MTPEIPPKSYDRAERTRAAVDQLRFLIDVLFEEPSPDIFTLKDFLNRYPLTGLGNLAIREIEQAQRINRSLDNYLNLGLCEFHIGLIYLYWGDFRGAITQFQSARKNWNFTDVTPSKSLCYFAEGLANFLALHYEEAMRCYGLANNALTRINQNYFEVYYQEISDYIKHAQIITRDAMWGRVRTKPSAEPASNGFRSKTNAQTHHEESEEPNTHSANEPAAQVSIPNQNEVGTEPEPPLSKSQESVPPPQIHLAPHSETELQSAKNPSIPSFIPEYDEPDSGYTWYQVQQRTTDNLYEDVLDGDWLLVHTQPSDETTIQPNELVLVLMEEAIGHAIQIRPNEQTPTRPYQRIYLAKNDDFIGPFNRNLETGEVSLIKVTFSSQDQQISVQWSAIIGVVEGFWRKKERGTMPTHLGKNR